MISHPAVSLTPDLTLRAPHHEFPSSSHKLSRPLVFGLSEGLLCMHHSHKSMFVSNIQHLLIVLYFNSNTVLYAHM